MVILYGIIWALWRRILGGWLNLRRPFVNCMVPILLLPVYLQSPHYIDVIVITGVTYAYWLCHVDFSKWWIALRYPVSGMAYAYCEKYWKNSWNRGTFIDGYSCVAEMIVGFCFGVTLTYLS